MDKFEKQPYEEFVISTDFSRNFGIDEIVSSQAVVVTDNTGATVSSTITDQLTVAHFGTGGVSVLVRAGENAKSPYKITFRCVTNQGHKWEHDIQMKVEEI